MQQEMADVAVTVVDPGPVHRASHACHFSDQGALEAWLRWLPAPVDAEVFEADGRCQFLRDDERVLGSRVAATFAVGHGGHGRHAGLMQALDGPPLLAGSQHRQFCRQQVLGHFAPADTPVDLDEIAAPLDLGTQGAAAFQLAVHLPLQALDFGKRIAPGPQPLEGFSQYQFHSRPWARITSAACCGML
ncbi:hypothetical protein D3C80_643470 [compost metagenome]